MPQPKDVDIQRVELRLRNDDPMVVELMAEVGVRGVTLQQHIFDLLRARYLARQGQSLHAALWYPTPGGGEVADPPNGSDSDDAPGARAAAAFWADMQ